MGGREVEKRWRSGDRLRKRGTGRWKGERQRRGQEGGPRRGRRMGRKVKKT
jgi:hypothetical protein